MISISSKGQVNGSGFMVGSGVVGYEVGSSVGREVTGSLVGINVGEVVGPLVGEVVGLPVGLVVVGCLVGGSEHSVTTPHGNTPFQFKLTVPVAG